MKTIRITVRGKVQGVFFRASTVKKAKALGVTGWVKNRDSGEVDIVATGNAGDLEALVEWCREGPPKAEVEDVQIGEMSLEIFDEFKKIS